MTETPLISVGMSVHNNEQTLAVALKSILRQSITNWELILIDDGSTDGTLEVAQTFSDQRIRILSYPEKRGLAERLNQGIELARGKYFARMDGDDVCFPERFARQVEFLECSAETDLLGAGSIFFGADGAPTGVFLPRADHQSICKRPWSGFALPHPSWMGRLEWFRGNRYDERVLKAQDYDLLLRTHQHSRFAAISEPLIGYRVEKFSLQKTIFSRISSVNCYRRYAKRNGYWLNYLCAAGNQLIKGLAEIAVVGLCLEQRLMRRKIQPLDADFANRWRTIWRDCQP